MSSGTVSLFASVALAMAGAAALAYSLSHPGAFTAFAQRTLAGIDKPGAAPELSSYIPDSVEHRGRSQSRRTVSIAAADYGHFLTEAEIDGRSVNVMVDTGASLVALTYEDAADLGIFVRPSDFTHVVQTANGPARVAPVTISSISIGDITVRDVPAVVSERGKSGRTLLGMSFLGRLSSVEMRGGTLVLQE
jgi:aspartyl protease family protein